MQLRINWFQLRLEPLPPYGTAAPSVAQQYVYYTGALLTLLTISIIKKITGKLEKGVNPLR